jgi:hypothetical protein
MSLWMDTVRALGVHSFKRMQALRQICFAVVALLVSGSATVAQNAYFPKGAFYDSPRADQFKSEWYSKQLTALEEPSLMALAATHKGESYRFLWLRTFDHPIAVRIQVSADGTSQLTKKMTSGAGGFGAGHLVLSKTSTLTKEQTDAFLAMVNDSNLWKLPTTQKDQGVDGAQWIIELAKDGVYHVVDRWSPRDGPVRETGMMMVHDLGKLDVPGPTY